jgi:hypothetical protein
LDLIACWRSDVDGHERIQPAGISKSPTDGGSSFRFLPDLAHGRFEIHPLFIRAIVVGEIAGWPGRLKSVGDRR